METSSNGPYRQTRKRKRLNYFTENRKKRVACEYPMKMVFGIELLLDSILKHLQSQDLKQSRQVNKQWHNRSTKILLQKQSFKVTLKLKRTSKNNNGTPKLIALTETIETSLKLNLPFPSCRFVFHNCTLSNRHFQHVLSTYGHMIHTLNISFGNMNLPVVKGQSFLRRFKQLVLDQLPNVEELVLASKTCKIWGTETLETFKQSSLGESKSKSTCYPKLKTLRVESELPRHVFEFLTQAAVNMEVIHLERNVNKNEDFFEVLQSSNKTHLLTSTFISFDNNNNLDRIDRYLGSAKLNLKTLNLYLNNTYYPTNERLRVSNAVTSLLQACSNSLQVLRMYNFEVSPEFEVPIMQRLQVIFILVPFYYPAFLPTKRFKISSVFPRLSMIYLQYAFRKSNITTQELYGDAFLGADYEDTVLSVETVEFKNIENQSDLYCVQGLSRLFTNLKTVRIWNLSNITQVLETLWDLPVVEVVYFSVNIKTLSIGQNTSSNTNAFTALDSALTGIPEEKCVKLSGKRSVAAINNLKLKKSLLDAKCLRKLFIRIDDGDIKERTSPTKTILSKIARKYAFEMCRQVEVCIILVTKHQDNLKYLIGGVSPVLKTLKKVGEKEVSKIHNEAYGYYLPTESTSFANRLAIVTT